MSHSSSRRASGPAPTRPGSRAAPGGRRASRRAPGWPPGAASPSAPTPEVMHRPPARALAGVLAPVAECRRRIRSGTTAIPDRVPMHYRALSRSVDSVTDADHRSQHVPASVGVESRRWSGRRRGSVSVSRTRPRTRSCARRLVVEGGGGGAIGTADELALRERPGALGANSRRAGGSGSTRAGEGARGQQPSPPATARAWIGGHSVACSISSIEIGDRVAVRGWASSRS